MGFLVSLLMLLQVMWLGDVPLLCLPCPDSPRHWGMLLPCARRMLPNPKLLSIQSWLFQTELAGFGSLHKAEHHSW